MPTPQPILARSPQPIIMFVLCLPIKPKENEAITVSVYRKGGKFHNYKHLTISTMKRIVRHTEEFRLTQPLQGYEYGEFRTINYDTSTN